VKNKKSVRRGKKRSNHQEGRGHHVRCKNKNYMGQRKQIQQKKTEPEREREGKRDWEKKAKRKNKGKKEITHTKLQMVLARGKTHKILAKPESVEGG